MTRRTKLFAALTVVFGIACLASRGHGRDRPRTSVAAVGPIERAIPAGAAVAEDEATLSRWLADPNGPQEIWLRGREYRGDFSAERPVAIRGVRGTRLVGSGQGTVLTLAGRGSQLDNLTVRNSGRRQTREDAAVRATAADISIERVKVEDALFGIVLGPCERCRIEHSHVVGRPEDPLQGDGIKLWEASHATVHDCLVEGTRDVVVWYSRHVSLARNTVTGSRYGTHFMYAHDSKVEDSELTRNVVGIFVMYSSRLTIERNRLTGAGGPAGVGIGFKESDGATVSDNWLVADTTATYLDRTPRSAATPVRFHGNHFALNDVALSLHSSEEGLEFAGNEFTSNATVIQVEGGGNALAASFRNNSWSDYQGYDLDHDGRGDVPYQVKVLSSELSEREPSLQLYGGTAAFAVIDLIARASPVFASRLLLVDPTPRVHAQGGAS
ncbi:MAG TPA: nitrous oxide reductase family maturation protein NosD [Polyangiaceae bacterium]|nr:nitrous oxide reductase family maturation protein NosD [Polyangiaceae bacterium]